MPATEDTAGLLRVDRASLGRWLVTDGTQGRPLSPRNAWVLIALASGDKSFSGRCLGLLERPEDVSRTRERLRKQGLLELAPRLSGARQRWCCACRRARHDASLAQTDFSAAGAYGWTAPAADVGWVLDAYGSVDAVAAALEHQATLVDGPDHGNQKRCCCGLWTTVALPPTTSWRRNRWLHSTFSKIPIRG